MEDRTTVLSPFTTCQLEDFRDMSHRFRRATGICPLPLPTPPNPPPPAPDVGSAMIGAQDRQTAFNSFSLLLFLRHSLSRAYGIHLATRTLILRFRFFFVTLSL
jgi:hypothetical protein